MMLRKKLSNLKRLIKSYRNKAYQYSLCLYPNPMGFALLPSLEVSCQDCNNQLLLWKYKLLLKKWRVIEYKVNNDKCKCCDYLSQLKSKESQLMKLLKE